MEDGIENLHIPFIPRVQNQDGKDEDDKEESQILMSSSKHHEQSDHPNLQSLVQQVAMTVPTTDDPNLPVLTFRTWTLGIFSCVVLSFLNQFFWYRTEPLSITGIAAQVAVVPLGHWMASTLPVGLFFKDTRWEFSLNPGPFNVKEHVLITIFANAGAGAVYAIHVVTGVKVFYKKHITFFVSLLLVVTSQALGFGWAGIFRRYLVEPAEMWWPANLVQVSLFRALHEKEERPRGGLTRIQFFIIAFTCSSAYYVFPGYLFRMLTSFSWICWLFPKSVLAQQLGSGLHGIGIATLGMDWSTISSYLRSPLASPWFATVNVAVWIFSCHVCAYPDWLLAQCLQCKYLSKYFQTISLHQMAQLTMSQLSCFHFDHEAYEKQGRLHLSISFLVTYGVGFAVLSGTIVHVVLLHGRDLWAQSRRSFKEKKMDIHAKLMTRYQKAPEWWFWVMLAITISITIFACEHYKEQLQLPWWGILLASFGAFVFTLPIGIITAIANQTPGLNIMSEYVIGYVYPGYPIANMCFKVYGNISMKQAVTFLKDFKLGHYMKIPPRAMFIAQVVGTLISSIVYLGTAWWLMETVPDICESNPSTTSVWTCPVDTVFYDASVIWGLIVGLFSVFVVDVS